MLKGKEVMILPDKFCSYCDLNLNKLVKHSKIIFLGLCLFSFLSCGPGYYQFYSGPKLSPNEVAVLLCQSGTPIKLFSVDDMEGPNDAGQLFPNRGEFGSGAGNSFHIELLPGRYVLRVGYHKVSMKLRSEVALYSAADQVLKFEAKVGRKYTIEVETWDDFWKAKVVEVKK